MNIPSCSMRVLELIRGLALNFVIILSFILTPVVREGGGFKLKSGHKSLDHWNDQKLARFCWCNNLKISTEHKETITAHK